MYYIAMAKPIYPMETNAEIQSVELIPSCVECGQDMYDEVYKTPLCTGCRQKFIKYPIPLSIKIFGTVILLVMISSLYVLPRTLKTGIHFRKGINAEVKQNYRTAEQEFARVAITAPECLEAQCRLLLAAYHNKNYRTVAETYEHVKNKNIQDSVLFEHISTALQNVFPNFPSLSSSVAGNHERASLSQTASGFINVAATGKETTGY